MPIIRAVNGIVEMHPALPVSPRPPAIQVAAAGREDRSKGQERQTADHAKGVHHLPVTSVHGTLVGMISNYDLLPYAHELESVNSPGPSAGHKLARVMSSRVLSATATTETREIAHVMLNEQVSAIPILDSSPSSGRHSDKQRYSPSHRPPKPPRTLVIANPDYLAALRLRTTAGAPTPGQTPSRLRKNSVGTPELHRSARLKQRENTADGPFQQPARSTRSIARRWQPARLSVPLHPRHSK